MLIALQTVTRNQENEFAYYRLAKKNVWFEKFNGLMLLHEVVKTSVHSFYGAH